MQPGIQYGRLTPDLIARLGQIVGDKYVLSGEGRENYARDEAPNSQPFLPEAVVKPENAFSISAIMCLANLHRIPVTPRGAGTGISGGAVPSLGGISISLERMKRILEIDEANFCATVEAGICLNEFCSEVEKRGLYYPLYPGELSATLGGNVATNAGGMRAVKYGVTRNFIMGLEAVLPTGEIIRTGGKYIKSSTGYDLTQLLTGSEGTLAIITQLTLKLIAPPGSREILLVPFKTLSEAIGCVPPILKEKILPVGIEFMEQDIFEMVEEYAQKKIPLHGYPAYLMIMLEADNQDQFHSQAELLTAVCLAHGAVDVFVPDSEKAKRNLLEAREKFYPTIQHYGMLDIADVVVPRSQIAAFVEKVKEISRKFDIKVVAYGHAGDGNVHLHPLGAEKESARVKDLMVELYQAGIVLGGTISGEHGLGKDKKAYLRLAASAEKIELMRRIKTAFDPNHIMNPGKVFDW
jgi:glycolate oxidase